MSKLQELRESKIKIELELRSLMAPFRSSSPSSSTTNVTEVQNSDDGDNLVVVPRHLLTSKVLNSMGLNSLVETGNLYNLTINREFFHDNLVIPEGTKNLFIFNTTKPLSIPKRLHHNFAKFIDNSPPFNLPELVNLVDYYL
ncbi:uncharacterized protein RJT20DRAFT_3831 [Scheffersomyces xylosifermentans]|uniref:uncharacterized protein n=1 Tax=Scheffersomyces xylosifermentans TaxID=1304137 RepID=UPI00315DFF1B